MNTVMSGEEIDKFSDKELETKLPLITVFYRTNPCE